MPKLSFPLESILADKLTGHILKSNLNVFAVTIRSRKKKEKKIPRRWPYLERLVNRRYLACADIAVVVVVLPPSRADNVSHTSGTTQEISITFDRSLLYSLYA